MSRAICLMVTLLMLGINASHAAGIYDPTIEWRTIHSPRFAVHYPDGARNLGVRVSRIAEEVLDEVTELIGFKPEGTIEIVLSDAVDFANGSAQVMPKNILRLFLSAPTELTGLSSYEDWLRILLIHEITHIADIDQTWGLTRVARWIFGKYIAMNGFSPQFFTEGFAVYAETLLTSTGRGRSTYVDMLLRMAAFEDKFVSIDQANLLFSDWPGAGAAYYYGGKFHLWLAKQFGQDKVSQLHHFNAGMPFPYFYWPGAMWVLGEDLPTLWDKWRKEVKQQAKDLNSRLTKEGKTKSKRITHHGRNISGAQYSPDGSYILYSRSSPVDGATVRRVDRDGSDDRHLILDTFSPRVSFSQDGSHFYFSQSAINERFNSFNDLYRYELESKLFSRLVDVDNPKKSLRARSPSVSADGKRIVFVQNKLHQNWVSIGEFVPNKDAPDKLPTKMKIRTLIAPYGDMQHASPIFSPDGQSVVVSTWFPNGHRDVIVVNAKTGELEHRITNDMAQDGNATWSHDGAYLLYESDRDGISNIYAYHLPTRRDFRVTRVLGGAFQPDVSPDGKQILFRNCSGIGFDIHEIPFDIAGWEEEPSSSRARNVTRPEPWEGSESSAELLMSTKPIGSEMLSPDGTWRVDEAPIALKEFESEEAYSPFRTLLPFQDNWVLFPALFFLNDDPSFSVQTLGADVLGEHLYRLSLGSSWMTQHPNFSVFYLNDTWHPSLSIGFRDFKFSLARGAMGSYLPSDFADSAAASNANSIFDATWRELQRTRGVTASMSLPIKTRHFLGFSYHFERRTRESSISYWQDGEAIEEFPTDIVNRYELLAQSELNRGCYAQGRAGQCDFAWVELGYSYSHTRWFPYSVSNEHGKSIGVSAAYYSKALGGDFDEFLLNFDGSLYINNPLFDNHVLWLRTRGAIALGPDYEETFLLGGTYANSIFTATTARTFPLRGFSLTEAEQKTGVLAAYMEYRFPIWHIERGLWTLPVYFERLSAALFMEGGNSFGNTEDTSLKKVVDKGWRRLLGGKASVGAEVRASIKLGWAFPLLMRFGAAWPVVDNGHLRSVSPEWIVSLGL